MTYRLDPKILNGRFGDPVVHVDLRFERRGILLDIGDISALPRAKLVQVSDVCVSHAHMDHFTGFDSFVRRLLTLDKSVRIFGPAGMIDRVGHHLAGFDWNLVGETSPDLQFHVTEMVTASDLQTGIFRLRNRFVRPVPEAARTRDGLLHEDHDVRLRGALLDHKIPSMAFSIEEPKSINILKSGLDDLGLATGPWLDILKDRVAADAPGYTPIKAIAEDGRSVTYPLGNLLGTVVTVTAGHKIAYVVDAAPSDANESRIIGLAQGADVLFIEAAFAGADALLAAERCHLTAEDAGRAAALAGVRRVEPIHISLRHEGEEARIVGEVEAAFRRFGGGAHAGRANASRQGA